MENLAPTVVAVVVAGEPGPFLDELIDSLAAQHYESLSILVLANGDAEGVTTAVAAKDPSIFVGTVEPSLGYGATANAALSMVEGADFLLFCHDDCSLEPGALAIMVETAFRENAGIVSPKLVAAESPDVILHVGINVDRVGAVQDRVSLGEIDHGQHDSVREVFCAPGGVALVRADLYRTIGGFDAGIYAMGEDLDLSWRAQVAGARIVVAPAAKVLHHERLAAGSREPADLALPSVQELQRRHEIRAMLVSTSGRGLLLAVPMALLLTLAEMVISGFGGDEQRPAMLWRAWRWNLAQRSDIKVRRAQLAPLRRRSNSEVHDRQVRGSIRLRLFFGRLWYQGLAVARGTGSVPGDVEIEEGPSLTGSIGVAFSENQDFDELDDLGHRAGRRGGANRILVSRSGRAAVWVFALCIYLFGVRHVVFSTLPTLGQFVALPSWHGSWTAFFTGWHPAGIGQTAPGSPGYATVAVFGVATAFHMGLLLNVMVIAALPIGVAGVARILQSLVSPRARLVGSLAYGALALFPAAFSTARLDVLVTIAALPWLVRAALRTTGHLPGRRPASGRRFGHRGGSRSKVGTLVTFAVLSAMAFSLAPAIVVALVVVALGFVGAGMITGGPARGLVGFVVAGTTMAVALCAPYVIATALHPSQIAAMFGQRIAPSSAPSLASIVSFSIGGHGPGVLAWALIIAAAMPLAVLRGERLVFASRLAMVAILSWMLVLVTTRGLTGQFAPSPGILLVPAALAVAILVGYAISVFEVELGAVTFGWRQGVAVVGLTAAIIGLVPFVIATGGGSFGLPSAGVTQQLTNVALPPQAGSARVLWLGEAMVLPVASFPIEPGLSFATTTNAVVSPLEHFTAADGGPATMIGDLVRQIQDGQTIRAGQSLALYGIVEVVVDTSSAPSLTTSDPSTVVPVPTSLLLGLRAQEDLTSVDVGSGLEVFVVTHAPGVSKVKTSHGKVVPVFSGEPDEIVGSGTVPGGNLSVAVNPPSSLRVTVGGHAINPTSLTPLGPRFVVPAGTGTTALVSSPRNALLGWLSLIVWLALALGLIGRERWLDWWLPAIRRSRRRGPEKAPSDESPLIETADPLHQVSP